MDIVDDCIVLVVNKHDIVDKLASMERLDVDIIWVNGKKPTGYNPFESKGTIEDELYLIISTTDFKMVYSPIVPDDDPIDFESFLSLFACKNENKKDKIGGKIMFKIGDKVWDIRFGWGTVMSLKEGADYPVIASFGRGYDVSYTMGGEEYIGTNRSLFFNEFTVPEVALKKPRIGFYEMVKNCEKVPFTPNVKNYHITLYHDYNGKVVPSINYSTTMEIPEIKYISYEDARRIVKECKENN